MRIWPLTPLLPGQNTLVLEMEVGTQELLEEYVLDLHEAGGGRTVSILEILFP